MEQNRREFLLAAAAAAAATGVACGSRTEAGSVPTARSIPANEKINIAIIGCGGKGQSDARNVAHENIVALCDVDEVRARRTMGEHAGKPFYSDFRELLDREKNLDAVTISIPDHTHAVAAVYAMQRGLHVFCQKPLTHTVEEARVLRELAARNNLVTQMGNQYTAHNGLRRGVELVRAGVIGDVREVHVWTNRPIWPQGIDRPTEILPIPSTLRWDLWLGPAPHRPYAEGYAPFNWRGWWDFGTGALGDMACHTLNLPYMALELGNPTSVEAESSGIHPESAPNWSVIRYEFPVRGDRPPVSLTWSDGGKLPPGDLLPDGVEITRSGSLLVGDKGTMYAPGDYATQTHLYPEENFQSLDHIPETLPRSEDHAQEWLDGIRGGPRPMSNFDYAGPLTEVILLGNVALRSGEKLSWDPAAMTTGSAEADRYLRVEYGRGYSIEM